MLFYRLHSSPELRHHLLLKSKAALRRHRQLQTLWSIGRLLLLVSILAGACIALRQQPGLPKDMLETVKGLLPFHHYTGKLRTSV